MLIAQTLEALERKFVVRTFCFLQTEHIRPDQLDEFGHASMRNRTELMFQVVMVRRISVAL